MVTTIKVNGKEIKLTSIWANEKKALWGANEIQHHIVMVEVDGVSHNFDYWASQAHPIIDSESRLIEAFHCFVRDAVNGDYGFYEFCNEFGYDVYDEDEKKRVSPIYQGCRENKLKYDKLNLGDVWDFSNELEEMYNL